MRRVVGFASEPKADVSVVLRNPQAMDSARNQVLFALNDIWRNGARSAWLPATSGSGRH